jgi:hypothetical protein
MDMVRVFQLSTKAAIIYFVAFAPQAFFKLVTCHMGSFPEFGRGPGIFCADPGMFSSNTE